MNERRKESPEASLCLRKWVNVFDAETSQRCIVALGIAVGIEQGKRASQLSDLESTEGQLF